VKRLFAGYIAGFVVATSASWLRVLLAGTLFIDTLRWPFAVSSLVLGAGLALSSVCAWKLAEAAPPSGTTLRWAVLAQVVMLFAAPLTSADFYQYVAYGLMDAAGKNPLAYGPAVLGESPIVHLVSQRWLSQPSVYGPVLLLLFKGVAFATGESFLGTAIVLKLAMAGLTVLCCALVATVSSARVTALFALSPLLAWELSGQAHSDAVLLFLLLVFVWAATNGRETLAAAAAVVATLGKVTMAPVLALYLLFLFKRRPLRAVALGAGGLALTIVLSIPYATDFPGVGPFLTAVRGTRSHSLADLLAFVLAPIGPQAQEIAVRASFLVCMAACAVVSTAVTWRARTAHELVRGCLVFFLVWDVTVPLFQPWYIAWLFPLALVDPDHRWLRLVALFGIFSVVQWMVQLDPLSSVVIDGWVVYRMVQLLRSPEADVVPAPAQRATS
jgi:hypothetical protein